LETAGQYLPFIETLRSIQAGNHSPLYFFYGEPIPSGYISLSRWGRSTTDLLATLKEMEARRVSLVALNGMVFDLTTPHGRMMATLLAGIAEFEREVRVEVRPAVTRVMRDATQQKAGQAQSSDQGASEAARQAQQQRLAGARL
jgi:DNA invertase Pin-like site-specific DNA recombinase